MADGKDAETRRGRRGIEPARKQNLVSLISYQPGSVVSRAIVDHPAGTVTLFAFDKGEGLSEHTAPYDALVQILEGMALVTVSGASNELGEGEAIILPAGEPHSIRGTGRFKMLLTMIKQRQS